MRTARHAADRRSIDGRIPPSQDRKPFFADDALDDAFALKAIKFFHGQKCHAYCVGTGRGQRETQLATLPHEKLVRNLDQNPSAVARFRIAATGPAVGQVDEHLNALANNFMGRVAANAGDKADAARIMLMRRIVKTLRWRQTVLCALSRHLNLFHSGSRLRPPASGGDNSPSSVLAPRLRQVQRRVSMRGMKISGLEKSAF